MMMMDDCICGSAILCESRASSDVGLLHAGQPFNVCVNCWDKVKNTHTGCRVWVHKQMERAEPGIIERMQREISVHGMDSPLFAEFEEKFLLWVDRCLVGHAFNVNLTCMIVISQ